MPSRKRIPPKPEGEQGVYPRWSPRQWAWVWDATANVDGKQKQSRGHASKHDARIARAEMQVSLHRGTQGKAPARLTLGDLVTKYWLPARENDLTVENSRHQVRWAAAHIEQDVIDTENKTTLGSIRLAQLTPDHIERWKRSLTAQGMAQTSRRLLFMRLKEVLGWAVRHEMTYRNVSDLVEAPRKGNYTPPVLDVEVVQRLLKVADGTRLGLMVCFVCMTGMRSTEVRNLTWHAIDFAEGTLRTRSKTPSGTRTIALGPELLQRLYEHRQQQQRDAFEHDVPAPQYVFLDERGLPWSKGKRDREWYIVRARAGLDKMHFHDLRHAHATLLAKAHVHPKVVQERMGHASPDLALQVYTQTDASQQVEAAKAVEALIWAPVVPET